MVVSFLCLLQCVLENNPYISVGSLYNEDLPVCDNNHLTTLNTKYAVEKDLISSSFSYSELLSCEKRCQISNDSSYTSNVKFLLGTEPEMLLVDLFSSIGGVIGLYFGFSLLGLLDIFREKHSGKKRGHIGRITVLSATTFIAFMCAFLCTNSLQKYLWSHPIYKISSRKPLTANHWPRITFCVWPPFNITRLLEDSGFVNEARVLKYINLSKRHSVVSRLIQDLITHPNELKLEPEKLWLESSWSTTAFYFSAQDLGVLRKPTVSNIASESILNRCQSVHCKRDTKIKWLLKHEDTNENTRMNVFLHHEEDFPPLTLATRNIQTDHSIAVKRISKWEEIHNENQSSGKCLSHCLDESLIRHMHCRLPWMEMPLVRRCNITQFFQFIHWIWILKPGNRSFMDIFMERRGGDRCIQRCQRSTQMYYQIEEKNTVRVGPGFAFNVEVFNPIDDARFYVFYFDVHPTSFDDSMIHDGYGLAKFLSDMGGITGMTLGISLLSFLLNLLGKIKLTFKKLNAQLCM